MRDLNELTPAGVAPKVEPVPSRFRDAAPLFVKRAPFPMALLDSALYFVEVSATWPDFSRGQCANPIGLSVSEARFGLEPGHIERLRHALIKVGGAGPAAPIVQMVGDRQFQWDVTPWGDDESADAGLLIVARDVTEHHKAEQEITRAKQFLETIFESLPLPMLVKTSSRKLIFANPAYAEIVGLSRDDIIGKTDYEIFPKEAADRFRKTDDEILHAGKINAIEDLPVDTAFGPRMFRVNAVAITDPDGARCVLAVGDDVTARFDVERALAQALDSAETATHELHEAQSELVAFARQAGMAEIANNVLHNVGNVLTSVNVSAGLVTSAIRDSKVPGLAKAVELLNAHAADLGAFLTGDERGKRLPGYLGKLAAALAAEQNAVIEELGSLTRSIDHIKDIVATQQSYSGTVSLVEPVRVADLLEDALRMDSVGLARHQVEVTRELSDLPSLLLDKSRVLQILVNLIANARQAMAGITGHGPCLTLQADAADMGDGQRLRIKVTDNGEGIAPENLGKLFVHGFTTRKNGHGFGLHGSALAAKAMGGSLTVSSDGPGLGASFTLELPFNPVGDIG